MSVVGIDVGNESGIVGVARQRGIDIVLNDESKRETPMLISFGENQRFLGVAGAACQMMNPKNTVAQIKRLIGRKFSDPSVQKDISTMPISVTEGPNGDPQINVMYMNEKKSFSPTEILAMALSDLKIIGEKNLGATVTDCVIGIPAYFTDAQRRAYLDAAKIASLNPLRLMHEPTATALAYGIYKTDLPETEPLHVAFVDIGHASMQVTVVAFKKGQLKILAHAFDDSLGGRDFDEALYDHFCKQFATEYSIDVRLNARASLRLRAACEKMKKVLSANPIAPLNIECLMDEKDVRGTMNREQFEELSAPVLERVKGPCLKALELSGLSASSVTVVEVVGSGSRVPAIMKILGQAFEREPSRTMNASESIARGCALQCAMLSPTFRVREFEVVDITAFPIAFAWKAAGEETAAESNQIIFPLGNPIPNSKLLTFYRTETFAVDAFYPPEAELPKGVTPKIGTYTVGPIPPSKSQDSKPKLKVKLRLSLHGLLSLESAQLLEEEESSKVRPSKDSSEPEATGAEGDGDAKMEDAEAAAGNGTQEGKTEAVKKKKVARVDVPFSSSMTGGMPPPALQQCVESEFTMALQDRVMEETKDKKNSVEAYVYEMRNKMGGALAEYTTEEEKERFGARLQETEDWLYEDGENETKGVYSAKLEELKKTGDPYESRRKEEEGCEGALSKLTYVITSFRAAATSEEAKYDHIDGEDKRKVVDECNSAEGWLRGKQAEQAPLPKTANPVLLASEIEGKAAALDRMCKPIMLKPKPAPAKPAQPPPSPNQSDSQKPTEAPPAGGGEEPAAQQAGGAEGDTMETDEATPAEKMDTES